MQNHKRLVFGASFIHRSCGQFEASLPSVMLWISGQGKKSNPCDSIAKAIWESRSHRFFSEKGSAMTRICVDAGTRWTQVCGGAHSTGRSHTPASTRAANDTTRFLGPAAIPSWIWELFPQMVDSLEKIFKHSNLPQRRSLRETRFCKVFAGVVSSSGSNP